MPQPALPAPATLISTLAACVLLAACRAPADPEALAAQTHPLPGGRRLVMEVGSATLRITQAEDSAVHLEGTLMQPDRAHLEISGQADELTIRVVDRTGGDPQAALADLIVQAPAGAHITVEAFAGQITVHDWQGTLHATSVTGSIEVERVQGELWLRAPRGDIRAVGCAGEVHLVGEHGTLSLENCSGQLAATSIMGTLRYSGTPDAGDEVLLEVDHGPVELRLGAGSNAAVQISTTSGRVTCSVPGMAGTFDACSAALGSGAGRLAIRTVSGAVTITPLF